MCCGGNVCGNCRHFVDGCNTQRRGYDAFFDEECGQVLSRDRDLYSSVAQKDFEVVIADIGDEPILQSDRRRRFVSNPVFVSSTIVKDETLFHNTEATFQRGKKRSAATLADYAEACRSAQSASKSE